MLVLMVLIVTCGTIAPESSGSPRNSRATIAILR
jgi:hypothetical protein